MTLKPLNDHVVVEAVKGKEEATRAGIILPDTVDKEKPEQGKVVAIGQGKLLDNGQRAAMSVKIGDVVLFKKYSPDEIKVGEQEFLVLAESDILAIIE
ncbi:MAG TPA: co-chaperone GroES [Candidatus Magasanikbacteria bacterium]|nr:co-chaperone GroES [Candidatus Magasanikbacteria bacterium]